MTFDLRRQLIAEVVGTAFLLATVIGSGIMAERLAGGSVGLALLCNTIPTGAILVVIILMFGPVSGAHFNPAVTFAFLLRREIAPGVAAAFVGAQIVGALAGTWLAHLMFDEPILMLSAKLRTGTGQWAGETVATFGLVATILACLRFHEEAIPYAVGLYITAAYWFTSSTSFANPAVTIARSLSNTFAGILPGHAPAFIAAQLIGAALAAWLFGWLLRPAGAAVPAKQRLRAAARRELTEFNNSAFPALSNHDNSMTTETRTGHSPQGDGRCGNAEDWWRSAGASS